MNKAMLRTGCISWTYPDWVGSFYPEGTSPRDFLSLYSNVFEVVEVDSTFYSNPRPSTVAQWKEKTPPDFLFTLKLPKRMTHDAKLNGISNSLENFEKLIKPLGPKLACVIAQMPPSLKFESGIEALTHFLGDIDPDIRYAIEFRHGSWFNQETFSLLKSKNVCLVWSVNEYVNERPAEVTSDLLYLRFMGKFGEFKKLDRVQKDKRDILGIWWKNLEQKLDSVERAFVLASNHFEGFAPETVNEFREAAGLNQVSWREKMASLGNQLLR